MGGIVEPGRARQEGIKVALDPFRIHPISSVPALALAPLFFCHRPPVREVTFHRYRRQSLAVVSTSRQPIDSALASLSTQPPSPLRSET